MFNPTAGSPSEPSFNILDDAFRTHLFIVSTSIYSCIFACALFVALVHVTVTMKHELAGEAEGDGITARLCEWIHDLKLQQIPSEVIERAKYLILDGVGCALVGAHVPWSEELAHSISQYEPQGVCGIIGYTKVSADFPPLFFPLQTPTSLIQMNLSVMDH